MNNYILIKLRSGEEIIASIKSKNRNGIKVIRPMQIRQVPFVDQVSGSLKAAVIFENWIGRTNENEVTIPNNWVGIKMIPSQEVIDAYERQMKHEDTPPQKQTQSVDMTDKEKEMAKKLEDEMTSMLSEMTKESDMPTPDVESMENFVKSMNEKSKKEMVIVNLMLPPNIFNKLIEEGYLDELLSFGMSYQDKEDDDLDDLEDDVDIKPKKKISKENGLDLDETGDETWGNSFKDWSANPNDYL